MNNIYKFLSTKVDKKGLPLRPFDMVEWAKAEGRPLTKAVLEEMAESIKKAVGNLDQHVMYVPSSALVMDQIFIQEILKASPPGLDEYHGYIMRFGLLLMVGLSINAINWDYSPIRFYNSASVVEAKEGYTADFASKHLSGTSDSKSARNVAKERIKDVEDKSISGLGKIVTTRSGAIAKEAIGEFVKEISSRQDEFTNTHVRLCRSFSANWLTMAEGTGFQYLDGITFRTKQTYPMFEFQDAKGVEGMYYIHFSLSPDEEGKRWAVHHLAKTSAESVAPNSANSVSQMLGQHQGQSAVDVMTTMKANPFEGGRKPPGL